EFGLRSTYGMDDELIAAFKERHIRIGDAGIGQAARQRAPLQIADLQTEPASDILDMVIRAGYRAVLIVPLLGAERIVGALVVRRKRPGEFSKQTIALRHTSAAHRCGRPRTRACSMRSKTRAVSSRRRASTNRNSSPT